MIHSSPDGCNSSSRPPQNVQNQQKYKYSCETFMSVPLLSTLTKSNRVSPSYSSQISFSQLNSSEQVVCLLLDVPAARLEKLKYSSRPTQKTSSCIWGCILSVPAARASCRFHSVCCRSSGAGTNTQSQSRFWFHPNCINRNHMWPCRSATTHQLIH